MAPGVISMTILFTATFSGIAMLFDRQFGFLKETLVAPVPRIEVMIGRTLGGATVAVLQGTLILAVCLIAGFRPAQLSLFPLVFLFMGLHVSCLTNSRHVDLMQCSNLLSLLQDEGTFPEASNTDFA